VPTYTVQLPNGLVVSKVLPADLTDEQVREAFAQDMRSHGINSQMQAVQRPDPQTMAMNALYGNLQAPEPTLASGLSDGIRNALYGLGVDEGYASHFADRATNFLNDLTPVGDAISFDDARQAWNRGDYLAAGGNALMGVLGAVPGFGDAAAGTAKAIIAPLFHGSPHKFDKFSLDRIGTGEGAQAYGHGLYFAENPKVAEEYRDMAARSAPKARGGVDLQELYQFLPTEPQTMRQAARDFGKLVEMGALQPSDRQTFLGLMQQNIAAAKQGHLYEVSLDAEPEDFLDWDRPLSEQPDAARRLAEEMNALGFFGRPLGDWARGNDLASRAGVSPLHNGIRTGDLQRETLLNAGIPGVRYLDQGSRGAGQGTRNYVVFDDSIIDILNRY